MRITNQRICSTFTDEMMKRHFKISFYKITLPVISYLEKKLFQSILKMEDCQLISSSFTQFLIKY